MVDNRIRQVVNYFEKNRNSLSEFRNTKRFFKTEVRKYLKLLSDRRVIKIHPIIWKPILNGIILNIRPKISKTLSKICTENGFPLLEYTEKQMENLKNICPEVEVTIGMSYSEPSIETALDTLLSKEIEELNVIPMYPQYSGTTVGSVFDSVMNYFIKVIG